MDQATGEPGAARQDGRDLAADDPREQAARAAEEREPGAGLVTHIANGAKPDDEQEEIDALDYILGTPRPFEHTVPVDYETPAGMGKIVFVLRMLDSHKIDEIEQRHITAGNIDQIGADVELVAEATKYLTNPRTGKVTELTSAEFLTFPDPKDAESTVQLASTHMALERRFYGQEGLLGGVAREVRRIAGFTPDRVGKAQRRLVAASLG